LPDPEDVDSLAQANALAGGVSKVLPSTLGKRPSTGVCPWHAGKSDWTFSAFGQQNPCRRSPWVPAENGELPRPPRASL